jgi:multisubunit Na+/H+ antiporter MnhE subunit
VARAWLIWFVLLAALYLLLVDTVVAPELVVGALAAATGATGAVLVRAQRRVLLRPRPGALRGAWRPVLGLFGDLGPLARVLVTRGILRRPGRGELRETPFGAVRDTPEDAAERALAETLGSLAPNTIVVDVDRERRVLVTHRLAP